MAQYRHDGKKENVGKLLSCLTLYSFEQKVKSKFDIFDVFYKNVLTKRGKCAMI